MLRGSSSHSLRLALSPSLRSSPLTSCHGNRERFTYDGYDFGDEIQDFVRIPYGDMIFRRRHIHNKMADTKVPAILSFHIYAFSQQVLML